MTVTTLPFPPFIPSSWTDVVLPEGTDDAIDDAGSVIVIVLGIGHPADVACTCPLLSKAIVNTFET